MRVIGITQDDVGRTTIIVSQRRWRWFRRVTEYTKFVGSGTVWHDALTGRRPGTSVEMWLSEKEWLYENRNIVG